MSPGRSLLIALRVGLSKNAGSFPALPTSKRTFFPLPLRGMLEACFLNDAKDGWIEMPQVEGMM